MIKFNHLIKEHLLYEGLIHSVSKTTFEDMVNRWSALQDKMVVFPVKGKSKLLLRFSQTITKKELDNLIKLANNLGWYISVYLTKENLKWKEFKDNVIDGTLISLQVEPKFDLDVTDQNFKILYHITPSINDKKISEIGLVPKSLNKISYHPERVYFGKSESDVDSLLAQFKKLRSTDDDCYYSIYQVDIGKEMKRNDQLRLFKDPNFENGFYTLSNIHKDNLKIIKK